MVIRRHVAALAALVLLGTSTALFAQDPPKLAKDEERELKAISGAMGNAQDGKAVTNAIGLTWLRDDALQAQGANTVMAFQVGVDPAKVQGGKVYLFWRVLPAAVPGDKKKPAVVFEKFSTYDVAAGATEVRIPRLFLGPIGAVDVFIGATSPGDGKTKVAPSVLRHTVNVPNLERGDFLVSNAYLFRGKKYTTALGPTDFFDHPYGSPDEEELPLDEPVYAQGEPLQLNGFVFNATGPVTCEYVATALAADGEKEAKKWAPTDINAKTSPGIPGSSGIPLSGLTAGRYRLDIKLTDKGSGKSISRSFPFQIAK